MGRRVGGRLWTAALTGASVFVLGVTSANAQTAGVPPAGAPPQPIGAPDRAPPRELLNPSAQTERQLRRPGDVFSAPEQTACPYSATDIPFRLLAVDVANSTVLDEADVQRAYLDMVGRDVPVSAICEIRDRLSRMLFRRGVLARVEIPAQSFPASGARIRLEVIEAKIVSIRYRPAGDLGPVQAKVEAYIDHLRGLAPFDLDTAQRYLLLANDIPGVRVSAALRPSTVVAATPEEARGAIDLEVSIIRKPVDLVGAVQNTSSKILGPWSGIARVDFNSFTRFGERTTLIGYTTLGENEQQVVQLVEEVRVGSSGLFTRGSLAYGRSRPGDILQDLRLRSDSVVGTLEVDYPAVRLRRRSLTLAAGFDFVDQKTDFPGGGLLTDDSLRVGWLRADGAVRREFQRPALGSWVTAVGGVSAQLRHGFSVLGASRKGEIALSRIEGDPKATVLRADGQAGLTFEPARPGMVPFALNLHVMAQWARRPLLSYEELAVGNLTIGQGYDPSAVSGDRAVLAEFKGQVGPVELFRGFAVAPYAFYDIARVSNLDSASEPRTLRAIGAGVEFHLPYGLRADIAYADPLDKTFAAATSEPPARVLVRLVAAR